MGSSPATPRKGSVYSKKGWLYVAFYPAPGAKRQLKATGLADTAENRRRVAALLTKRQDHVEAVAAATPDSGPLTVRRWAKRWLELRRAQGVASVADEETHLEAHVLPVIGEQLLNEVRPRHLVELFGALRRKPVARGSSGTLSPKYVYNIYGTVGSMFRDAKLEDVLLGDSPCILKKRQLGENVDKDPEWRPTAKYSRDELELLISGPEIPPDRQVLYALEGLGALRHGEAAGLRWRHYLADQQPLGRLIVATSYNKGRTKTKQVRFMPVHAPLAAVLAEWKLGGWPALMGRAPEPDDLVVPMPASARIPLGKMRTKNDSYKRLKADLEALQLRPRRGHDLRRTMISLAQDEGARKDILKMGTHGRSRRDAIDDYTSLEWETLCREVAKLQVVRRLEVAVKVVAIGGGGRGGSGPTATLLPGHESRGHETHVVSSAPAQASAGSLGKRPSRAGGGNVAPLGLPGSTPGASTSQHDGIAPHSGSGSNPGSSLRLVPSVKAETPAQAEPALQAAARAWARHETAETGGELLSAALAWARSCGWGRPGAAGTRRGHTPH